MESQAQFRPILSRQPISNRNESPVAAGQMSALLFFGRISPPNKSRLNPKSIFFIVFSKRVILFKNYSTSAQGCGSAACGGYWLNDTVKQNSIPGSIGVDVPLKHCKGEVALLIGGGSWKALLGIGAIRKTESSRPSKVFVSGRRFIGKQLIEDSYIRTYRRGQQVIVKDIYKSIEPPHRNKKAGCRIVALLNYRVDFDYAFVGVHAGVNNPGSLDNGYVADGVGVGAPGSEHGCCHHFAGVLCPGNVQNPQGIP